MNEAPIPGGDRSPVSDPFPIRRAGRKTPVPSRRSGSFIKLLTFKGDEGAMLDFPSERKLTPRMVWTIAALVVCAALVAAAFVLVPRWRRTVAAPQFGQLAIVSEPSGAEVIVDGQRRGVTPLTLALPSGAHALRLSRQDVTRIIAVTIKPGAEVVHHIDLEARPVAVPDVGQLLVTSERPGARVTLDGQARGVTPVSIADVPAGQHAVDIRSDTGSVQRTVTIERGQTASLMVTMNQTAFGWVSVTAPVVMQILENDRRLGTTETDRILMPAGKHTLKLVNTHLGYQQSQVVQVPAGGGATLKIGMPDGLVNLNALPWAEVWIDGRRIGETPLANFKLPIGDHEVLFRHPQLGERRQPFVVAADEPARVAVDLRK